MSLPAMNPTPLPILLIEDEPGVMAYVSATLERSGYQVVCANSGAAGLKLLETGTFLGVVSDMVTPGGVNGADVHAWIAANRPGLASRLVFKPGAPRVEKRLRGQQFISVVEQTMGKAL